ncbi:TetR/AcrR family transcriptional regulator [Amycolatopsis acididurans]|uniref:TetR/AcrR family transcriptional regulator n=1 Tax=Amycolatopsis acididurans TaxID=2724524 RepID=UPI001FE6E0DD|nr:TetR family transcriptional regulator [Amycolatopsis acididurans]
MLSRDRVVAAALRIIDNEGLAACSLPRLARQFGVRTPSLYHHFTDRAEIMAEVARAIVRETVVPQRDRDCFWTDWFVELGCNFRRTILRHPNAAPVLLEFVPRDVLSRLYDDAAAYLAASGVPSSRHVLILDGLETLTLGAALTQATKPAATREMIFPHTGGAGESALARAVKANEWRSTERLYVEVIRTFLRSASGQTEPETT